MHDLNEITLERSGRGRGWLGYLCTVVCLLSMSLRLVCFTYAASLVEPLDSPGLKVLNSLIRLKLVFWSMHRSWTKHTAR